MKNLILIKLGGSVITDKAKPFTARLDIIKRLVSEIKLGNKNNKAKIIIGHGSGSFAHVPAAKYQTQKGLINKNSVWGLGVTADAAIQINRIVVKEFLLQKVPVISFAPLSLTYANKEKPYQIITNNIEKALEIGILPVVYGDVIMDKKMSFCIFSGEKTLDLLAFELSNKYKIVKILMVGDTEGVYDKNGKTIPKITPALFGSIKKDLKGSSATDVTGGMLHKVKESLDLVQKLDTKVYILSGLSRGNLSKAILGQKVLSTVISN